MSESHIDRSGISIPADLVGHLVPVNTISANGWNPNHMDAFMREKLVKAIRADGFIVPILVRPETRADEIADGSKWEIVDGEHRWAVAESELGMEQVPILNLGSISDAQAKQITVKANTLRGEFDSVQLAEMLSDLVKDVGKSELIDSLPFTSERIDSMLALVNMDTSNLTLPSGDGDNKSEDGDGDAGKGDFKQFDPADMKFEHKCPRCNFEFNEKKED